MMEEINRYIKDDDDIAFEFELQSTPTNHQAWERYLNKWKQQLMKGERSDDDVIWLYRRYTQQFRESSDVWKEYIDWITEHKISKYHTNLTDVYRLALHLVKGKFEIICVPFLKYAISLMDMTLIVEALDMSLPLVPKNSHYKLWNLIIEFIQNSIIPVLNDETTDNKSQLERYELMVDNVINNKLDIQSEGGDNYSLNVCISQLLERYLVVCPKDSRIEILTMLGGTRNWISIKRTFDEYLFPTKTYDNIISDHIPYSLCLLYLQCLCQSENKFEAERREFSRIIESAYPFCWVTLKTMDSETLLSTGEYVKFEEHINDTLTQTKTMEDFNTIFSLYINAEQAIVGRALFHHKKCYNNPSIDLGELVTSHLQCLELLVESYPLKLNDCYLRRNVNDINVWNQRVNIYSTLQDKCTVFAEGVTRIDPLKVKTPGELGKFWCEYAKLYWVNDDTDSARELYEKALQVPFPHLKDLELIWIDWVGEELKLEGLERAFSLLQKALAVPDNALSLLDQFRNHQSGVPPQAVVFSSLNLWKTYLDLVESTKYSETNIGTSLYNEIGDVYNSLIKLKIITPLLFTSYAKLAKLYHDQEKCMQIYDRAVSSFPPVVTYDIWKVYLKDAIELLMPPEHIRDLFDTAFSHLTHYGIDTKELYFLNNEFEESRSGVTQGSIDFLLQGARTLNEKFVDSKLQLWDLAIEKTKSHFGLEAARPLFEECITVVPSDRSSSYIISFAEVEVILGEVVRAREILKYGSTLLPPVRNGMLWSYWETFELNNGDKQTYKDMIKLKMKLELEMKVDTEQISQESGNIEFVVSQHKKSLASSKEATVDKNPEEIELEL